MSRYFRSAREHAQEHAVLADEMVMARGSHMQRHDPRNGNAAARMQREQPVRQRPVGGGEGRQLEQPEHRDGG